jgi:methionyl-tRNA formyltransferase
MTAGDLHDAHDADRWCADLVARALAALERRRRSPFTPQQAQEGVALCRQDRQGRDAHRLDAARATDVHNHIRGLSPFPGAWFELPVAGKPERVKVLASERVDEVSVKPAGTVLDDRLTIACGTGGAVRLVRLQKAGGKPLDAADFLRGTPVPAGQVLA